MGLPGVFRVRIVPALLGCVAAVPGALQAQGFGVYEQGTCVMARAGAGVAAPCDDGSAVFVNPAGLAGRRGIIVGGGVTSIFPNSTFTSDSGGSSELSSGVLVPPHAYFQYGVSERLTIGAGLYLPYGLGVEWPLDFGGRFVSYDSTLASFYVQPTAAYAINDSLSVGGGLAIVISEVELNRREDLARVPLGVGGLTFGALVNNETDFADTRLSASGATGVGGHFGVLLRATDTVRVGARYLTKVTLDYEGEATFTPVPATFTVTKPNPLGLPVGAPLDSFVAQVLSALQNQDASTELTMPAQFVAGVSVQATPRLAFFGDYQWVQWSSFDAVTLDFSNPTPPDERLVQNYSDTHAVRLGTELETPWMVRLRAGYAFNQAAAPDETVTPLLPEARRNHATAGAGFALGSKVTLDLAYQFIAHADRRGRIVNPPPGEVPTVALNSGLYRSRGDLLGITISYRP
jgi:long-chain fatty acid transport protein